MADVARMGEGTTESIGESPADGHPHDWPQDDWVLRPWLLAGSLGLLGGADKMEA